MGKIIFHGDSLTAALEVPYATDRWTYRVGIHNGYAPADIINTGVSGNNSNQLLARFATDVLSHSDVDVLVMMFTVNDRTNGLTLAQSKANYLSMINQAEAAGIKVVLLSPNLYTSGLVYYAPWVELWDEIVGESGCYFIDVWKGFAWLTYTRTDWFQYYYHDYAHTNKNGNGAIYLITRLPQHDNARAFLK